MLYTVVWVWLVIQIPLGLVVGLVLRAGGRADWAGQDIELGLDAAAAHAEVPVEQGAG